MEHDDKFAAVVRSAAGAISGGSITGGEAVAVAPELESGGGAGTAVAGTAVAAANEPVEKRPVAQQEPPAPKDEPPAKDPKGKRQPNNVRRLRIERMMSKAELARRANLSVLTIDRVEKGYGCRMDSKRKILEALGLSLADRVRVFGEEE
jgi:DNA-binding XRE family transcriptional regulator